MKCIDCTNQSSFICNCSNIYLCEDHLGKHLKTQGKHSHEHLINPFSESEKIAFKQELQKRIKTIQKLMRYIAEQVKTFISQVKELEHKMLKTLTDQTSSFIHLLNENLFSELEIESIQKAMSTDFELKQVYGLEGINKIKEFFSQEFWELTRSEEKLYAWRREAFEKEHHSGFNCGAVTSDYSILVTGCEDGSVRTWDLISKSHKAYLGSHLGQVQSVVLSESLKLAVTGSFDKTIIVWSTKKNQKESILLGHTGAVYSLALLNSSSVISGGLRSEILIWDLKTRKLSRKIDLNFPCYSLVFSKRLDRLFCGLSKDLEVWNLKNSSRVSIMLKHEAPVTCLAMNSDETLLLSGSCDWSICIWDAKTFKYDSALKGHDNDVYSIFITPDNQFVFSGSKDTTIRVWNLKSRTQVQVIEYHTARVQCVVLCGNKFLSLCQDATVVLWDLKNKTSLNVMHKERYFMRSEVFTSDSKFVGYGSGKRAVIWNLTEQREEYSLSDNWNVRCVGISEKMEFAVIGLQSLQGNVVYWRFEEGVKPVVLNGHSNTVFSVSVSCDGLLCVSGSGDTSVRLWDIKTFKLITEFKGHSGHVYSTAITRNCKFAVSAGQDKKVMIWDVDSKTLYASLISHTCLIWKVIVSSDDQFAVSCTYEEGVIVWDIKNQQLVVSFKNIMEACDWLRTRKCEKDLIRNFLFS